MKRSSNIDPGATRGSSWRGNYGEIVCERGEISDWAFYLLLEGFATCTSVNSHFPLIRSPADHLLNMYLYFAFVCC